MGLPIVQIIAFFPLLLPIWQERPLTATDLRPGDYPTQVTEEDVAIQREGLHYGNRELRSTVYRQLREIALPSAYQLLAESLRTETEPRLVPVVLQQLALCPTPPPVNAAALEACLKSGDSDTRYWAIRLAGAIATFPADRLAAYAANETESRLRLAACQAIAARGAQFPLDSLRPLWNHADPVVRACALAASLRVGGALQQAVHLPEKTLTDNVQVRSALAQAVARAASDDASQLIPALVRDSHPTVRGCLARSLGTRADSAYRDLLLGLARDPDPEVRRQAAESLAVFPEPATRAVLVQLLGDPRALVRRQAEESLVQIHAACPVDEAIGKRLADPTDYTRYHVFRLLGRLDSRGFAPAIAERLPLEKEPVNTAAAVFALGRFEYRPAAPPIAALAAHADRGVRTAVGRALGALAVPATYATIQQLAFDPEDEVRQAAIIAMGNIADGTTFNPTLLKVLQTVKEGTMSGDNRGAAAWAVGRTRPCLPALADRLVVQATTPVVPGPMGEMLFEPDEVLAACAFALAQMRHDEPIFQAQFEAVAKVHSRVYAEDEYPAPGGLLPSPEIREACRQVRAWLNGQTPEPALRPTSAKVYDYGLYRRPAP